MRRGASRLSTKLDYGASPRESLEVVAQRGTGGMGLTPPQVGHGTYFRAQWG